MKIKRKNLTNLATAISFALGGADMAVAQDSGIEEIVVKGVRESLRQAIEVKRNGRSIVDSITAEDIGKFPDENVAQSLQRIAGASISRPRGGSAGAQSGSTDGRLGGQFVQIRGLPADFSQVTLNGRSLASARNIGRQFSLDVLPSEFISRLDVYKTVPSDQLEGGIGGNINVVTRKPLDNGGQAVTGFSAETVYSDLPDSTDPKISGVWSRSFNDGTLGVLLAGTYSERGAREDEYFSWGDVNFGGGVDERTDLGTIPGGTDDGTVEYPTATWPIEPTTQLYTDDREKTGLNGVIQWKPSDSLDITFDALYSSVKINQFATNLPTRYQFRGPQSSDPTDLVGTDLIDVNGRGVGGVVPFLANPGVIIGPNNTLVFAAVDSIQFRSTTVNNDLDSETLAAGINFDWEYSENLSFAFDLGYSRGEQDNNEQAGQLQAFADATYDTRNASNGVPDIIITSVAGGTSLTDPDAWRFVSANTGDTNVLDESTTVALDVDFQVGGDFIESIETGIRYISREKEQNASRTSTFAGNQVAAVISAADVDLIDFPVNDLFGDSSAQHPRQWVIVDPLAINRRFADVATFDSLPLSDFNVEEEVVALYAKLNLDFDVGSVPITGTLGVRYTDTDVTSTGSLPEQINIISASDFSVVGAVSSTVSDYSNVLPSLMLNAKLSENLILRFGAGRTVTRPTLSELSPRFDFNTTTLTGSAGNPALEPFEADSYDLSLEWYFTEGGLLSGALFYKDVGGFIFSASAPETVAGVDFMAVRRPQNAGEAEITGLELSYQQEFDFLPGPFDGLGILMNYTYADSETGFPSDSVVPADAAFSYTGLSKSVYNIVPYYEKDRWSVRLSYNFRDEFLLEPAFGGFAGPRNVDSYKQLDLSMAYELNENFTLTFSAVNLTDEKYSRFFNDDKSIIASTNFTGQQYFFGIRGSF